MSTSLTNKIVFISGASSGIGTACAQLFAKQQAKLILCARREDRLTQLSLSLSKLTQVLPIVLDVTNRRTVADTIANLPPHWQDIDVLINNAGLAAGLDLFQDSDIDDWEAMIDTNIKGLLYLTKAILPFMLKRNSGHIINIGSVAGHEVYPKGHVYCASKHAVKAITSGLKLDLLGTRLRVSSVDPGMVNTEFSTVRFKGDTQQADKVYTGLMPLSGDDVADAVLYCATRPAHVNIKEIILLPTAQASATNVHREES